MRERGENEIETNKERGIRWIRKGKKRRKEKREKNNKRESKQGKIEKRKRRIFPVFGRSNPEGPRVKVDICIVSYAWVPISWSFVKLHEVRNFPT